MQPQILINTSEKVAHEMQYATPWRRMGEYIIDQIIVQILNIIAIALILWLGSETFGIDKLFSDNEPGIIAALIYALNFFINYLYYFILELAFNGKTFGKMALSVRTTGQYGEKARALPLLVRNLFRILWLIDGAFIFFNPSRRRLGDFVAGTIVINDDPAASPPVIDAREESLQLGCLPSSVLTENEFKAIELYLTSLNEFAIPARLNIEYKIQKFLEKKFGEPVTQAITHNTPIEFICQEILRQRGA